MTTRELVTRWELRSATERELMLAAVRITWELLRRSEGLEDPDPPEANATPDVDPAVLAEVDKTIADVDRFLREAMEEA